MITTLLGIPCIEDTPSDFHLIPRELRKSGLHGHCQCVDSSEARPGALAQQRWDLLFSDRSVPGMYFTDTLKLVRRDYADLPLILISGAFGEVKGGVMVEPGAWGFAPKSHSSGLVPTIEQVLQRRAETRNET